MIDERGCGVLLHPTSLPSPFGIGDLGKGAYDFIDFLHASGQKYWQILPLCPIGAGNSPYSSFSAFAGNTLLISPEKLIESGLLFPKDIEVIPQWNPHKVQYNAVKTYKKELFRKAFSNFKSADSSLISQYNKFCSNANFWLEDYSLYISIKEYYKKLRLDSQLDYEIICTHLGNLFDQQQIDEFYANGAWFSWSDELKNRNPHALAEIKVKLQDDIEYHKFLQFIFYTQWSDIKFYANKQNINIIGDVPIFVSYDSVDVWSKKELFDLDNDGFPQKVAGVPPDYFCCEGQLWGNPLYAWDEHHRTNYTWWKTRLRHMLNSVDYIRIDHFRGFEAYWAIPQKEKTALNGKWVKGPGHKIFKAFASDLGSLPIIAEDLGILTEEVHILRDTFDLIGMRVLQFAFENNNKNLYLPHNYCTNCVVYTGTHDNNTTLGWYRECDDTTKNHVRTYINSNDDDIVWKLIRLAYASVCNTIIVPMQDLQQLGSESRMNIPGVETGNWEWRYTQDMITGGIIDGLNYLRNLYDR